MIIDQGGEKKQSSFNILTGFLLSGYLGTAVLQECGRFMTLRIKV